MAIKVVMGYPASGKSTAVKKFVDEGFYQLNRDELGGTLDDVAQLVDEKLIEGISDIVLDNTYPTVKTRKKLIEIAKKHKIDIDCVEMSTSIEDSQVNASTRMIHMHGKLLMPEEIKKIKDPNTFPPAVLFRYRKQYEKPTVDEGFSTVSKEKFERIDNPHFINKAILLDYDGTLRETVNGNGKYPVKTSQIKILPGRKETLEKYLADGYRLLGVSNQGDIGRGKVEEDAIVECFEKTNELLGLDIEYKYCPHSPIPIHCYCRKPMPGLAIEFVEKYKLDKKQTIMVGDRTTDKTFAKRAGIRFEWADDFSRETFKLAPRIHVLKQNGVSKDIRRVSITTDSTISRKVR